MPISQTTAHDSRSATARSSRALLLSAACLILAVLLSAPVEAQNKKKKPAPAPAGGAPPGSGYMPGSSMPPNSMRGMGAGGYGAGGAKAINKKGPAERKAKSDEPVDPEKLPAEYHVPPEPTDALTTTDEWIEDPFVGEKPGQKRVFNAMMFKYKTIFQAGEFAGEADRKLVADILRYKLSLMTRKENRDKVQALRADILKDVAFSPAAKSGSRDVRKFMLKTIAEEAPRLFKYHAVARINGAILLAELSDPAYNEADGDGNRKSAEPCTKA